MLSVKEIIREIKTHLDILIDISFSAVALNNVELFEEASKIERKIHELSRQLNFQLMYVNTLSYEEAKSLEPILIFSYNIDKMADALCDIANVVKFSNLGYLYDRIWQDLPESIMRITVSDPKFANPIKYDTMHFRAEYNVDLIAVKRKNKTLVANEFKIQIGDVLLVRGEPDILVSLKNKFGDTNPIVVKTVQKDKGNSITDDEQSHEINQIVSSFKQDYIKITDMIETMVELSLSALMFSNEEIAKDVIEMEKVMDVLNVEFERKVFNCSCKLTNTDPLRGLLRIVYSCKKIADASEDIAEIVAQGIPSHPILKTAFSETSNILLKTRIMKDSSLVGKTMEYLDDPDNSFGFNVIALYRDNDWLYNIPDSCLIKMDDVLIVEGPLETAEKWKKIVEPNEAE